MNEVQKTWHFWLLLLILIGGGCFVHWRERTGDVLTARKPLRELPDNLGAWKKLGADAEFDNSIISVLRPDDYLLRDYFSAATGRTANIYIGYYNSQRTGATYHSPRNCLPGSGWTMADPQQIEIALPDGRKFVANHYTVENKGDKHTMIYWYQGRGRFVASEYADKFLTVWDSVRLRRSDGALVRVVTPFAKAEKESEQDAVELAARLAAELSAFVPER